MANVFCPSCGHPNHDAARFCEECGAALGAPADAAAQPTPPEGQAAVPAGPPPPPTVPVATPPTGGPDTNRNLIIGALVAVGLLAIVLTVLLTSGGGDDSGSDETFDTATTTTQPATTTSSTTSTTTTTTTTTTTPPPPPADNPLGLPSGLYCRDLAARGFSYADSVTYWEAEGRPDRMDADLNGYPCETVYPSSDVIAYWGFDPQGGGDPGTTGVQDLPAGLFCRDLNAMGYTYADAVGYWNVWGQPDRMDEDLDGFPCETVYSRADVIAYWGFDPG